MAKVDTQEREKPKKKKKAGAAAAAVGAKVKAKKAKAPKPPKASKPGKSDSGAKRSRRSEGFEGLAKFVDHPLVADLLAAGALAAVTAIAEHQLGDRKESSSKMVKSVGKAAATAMGRKLMGDIGAITTAATDAAKKA
jgi:hypothetical protein